MRSQNTDSLKCHLRSDCSGGSRPFLGEVTRHCSDYQEQDSEQCEAGQSYQQLAFCEVTGRRQRDAWPQLTVDGNSPDVCMAANEEAAAAEPELPGAIPKHMPVLGPASRVHISQMKWGELELTAPRTSPRVRSQPGHIPDRRALFLSLPAHTTCQLSGHYTLWPSSRLGCALM